MERKSREEKGGEREKERERERQTDRQTELENASRAIIFFQ